MARQSKRSGNAGIPLDMGDLTPKQKQFCQARSRYIAYGGARGGGKTHVLRTKACMGALIYPGIRILIVRREYPELEQTAIIPMRKWIPAQLASYNGTMHIMNFFNGSMIKFGHYGTNDDLEYQGQEYDWIFLDEATQFTEYQFRVLGACLRGASKIPRRMYLTCNPGGVGHFWVKRLFVTRDYRDGERAEDYTFIQATVQDNPYLLEGSPEYVMQLELLPEDKRDAWLYGNWDALSGAFFPEVTRKSHVIPDFPVLPAEWRKYRAFDFGLDMFACLWIAVDTEGRSYVYREVNQPNLTVSDAAARMLALTPPGEEITATFAPPDMWSRTKESGKTMAQLFAESGVGLLKASNSRVQGWMALKELLKPMGSPDGKPALLFCESCRTIFSHLSTIQHSTKDPNDCATEPHDVTHAPDALRYFAVSHILTPDQSLLPDAFQADRSDDLDYDPAYCDTMTGGEIDTGYLDF